MQLKWELGSPVLGLLLRKYAPHDTYEVRFMPQLHGACSRLGLRWTPAGAGEPHAKYAICCSMRQQRSNYRPREPGRDRLQN